MASKNQHRLGLAAAAAAGAWAGHALARPLYSFRHRSVLITGARGLALELARVVAEEGAAITLLARDGAELLRAREALARPGLELLTVECDVTDRRAVEDAVAGVIDRFGRLDVVINNAGVIQVGPIEHMRLADFEEAMAVHFWGPLHVTRAALPHMRRQHGGRVVNIASIGGKIPVPHLAPYVASKFALVGLSASLRMELERYDIVVTTVSPGLMRTGSPINATMKGQHEREFAWFAISDSMPGLSMHSQRAARRIIEACRRGRAELILTPQARLAAALYGVMPNTLSAIGGLAARMLPRPAGPHGDEPRLGRDSRSWLAPHWATAFGDAAARRNNEAARPRAAEDALDR